MTLRAKILLAELPLVCALLIISVVAGFFIHRLGQNAEKILADNYRSVLAIQRMTESADVMDRALLLATTGHRTQAEDIESHHRRFEEELRTQEGNLTEPGEREATVRLRLAWAEYTQRYQQFLSAADAAPPLSSKYLETMDPSMKELRDAAKAILALNQDAIVRKSERAGHVAKDSISLMIMTSFAGLLLAAWASAAMTTHLLRPVYVLGQATRRIGQGDLAARARVKGKGEIAALADDFNAMADRLQKYRESSLGDLLEAQHAVQAAIDSLPDPVLVISTDGNLRHGNRAAETLLKVSPKNGLAPLDPTLATVVNGLALRVGSGQGAYVSRSFEDAIRVATGEGDRHLLPRATPVYAEEGHLVGTTIILQDVTRFLRFEELRNNLVATVAHEFRTPLTSIRMAVHLLTEQQVGPLTDRQADLVFAAREDCDRLQSTVDELLDLSRIQSGRMDLRTRPVDTETLVRKALEASSTQASDRQVELRSEVLPGTGGVLVDPDRIQLVFANLLSNAIRHAPQGGSVTIRVRDSLRSIHFEVADTGPGIPTAYHRTIFEKYFQMPGTKGGAAGLGLFITKEIIEAHRGAIGVESEPGKGSTFWFDLPRAESDSEAIA